MVFNIHWTGSEEGVGAPWTHYLTAVSRKKNGKGPRSETSFKYLAKCFIFMVGIASFQPQKVLFAIGAINEN